MENTKSARRRHLVGAVLLTASSIFSAPASADTWACEVTLCLAHPKGAMAAPACVGPIKRLWRHLAYGHAMPTCPSLNGGGKNEEVRTEQASGKNCPAGQAYWGGQNGRELLCKMQGALTTYQDGQPQKRLWWNEEGESVTEYFTPPPNDGATLPAGSPANPLQ